MNTVTGDTEEEGFRKLVNRSKNIGDGWRQVSVGLWDFVKDQAAKQPGCFELDEERRRIRFVDYY